MERPKKEKLLFQYTYNEIKIPIQNVTFCIILQKKPFYHWNTRGYVPLEQALNLY